MAKQGRPKNTEASEPKNQVLIAKSVIKMAKIAAIKNDVNLSDLIALAIKAYVKG